MNKIYILLTGVLMTITVSAQLTNLNFEAPITQVQGFTNLNQTEGWFGVFTAETTDPAEGLQSYKMTTIQDPAIAAAYGFQTDTISGQLTSDFLLGEIINPEAITMGFTYKYAPVNNDVGFVAIEIWDTLPLPNNSVLLYQGVFLINNPVTSWTTGNVTLTPSGNTGNAEMMYIFAGSSYNSYFFPVSTIPPAALGSTLWLDDIVVNNLVLDVNEHTPAKAKVYPNPVMDVLNFTLENTEATAISIYSLDGKHMLSANVNGISGSIDVSFLNAGMYLYEITTRNGESVKSTFVKK